MDHLVVILVLISATIHASWNFFARKANDSQSFLYLAYALTPIVWLPLLFIIFDQAMSIPTEGILFVVLAGIIHTIYFMTLGAAYNAGELSLVYPIVNSSLLFTSLWMSLFFGEEIGLIGWFGILCIFAGVYTVQLKKLSLDSFLMPITRLPKDRAVQIALLVAFIISVAYVNDSHGVSYVNPPLFIYLLFVQTAIYPLPYFYFKKKSAL